MYDISIQLGGVILTKSSFSKLKFEDKYELGKNWGIHSAIDVYNCDMDLIRNSKVIKDYVIKLCELIDMKRFGDTYVTHFGEDENVAGYSMVQLIETSLISGHFANKTNTAYIDVFSCKYYDPVKVSEFTCEFFKGKHCKLNITFRK